MFGPRTKGPTAVGIASLIVSALLVVAVSTLGPRDSGASVFTNVRQRAAGGTVYEWQTSQVGDRLTPKPNLHFVPDDGPQVPAIDITPSQYFQAIDGFGGAFNESGWAVLKTLTPSARDAVLTRLFDPKRGAGFTLGRTPIGADDFSCRRPTDPSACSEYTYDDVRSGTDFSMRHFSIRRDLKSLVPYIRSAMAHGHLRLVATPWSAPAWMKTSHALDGGGSVISPTADPRYYSAYALYFQKYVQSYVHQGIPIDFVSVQNEPQYAAGFASTLWTPEQMATFVARDLGPRFVSYGVRARIRIYDHNRDTWEYPKRVLDRKDTAPYVAGVDFHNYECSFGQHRCMPQNLRRFSASHPGYSLWMTEHTNTGAPNPSDYLDGEKWGREIVTDLRHGIGGWIYWNLVLNQDGGPVSPKSGVQDPLVAVDTNTHKVNYLAKYWYLAQFSRFVRPGAYRIGAKGHGIDRHLDFVAFKNRSGAEVVVVVNSGSAESRIKIREQGRTISPVLAAHSIATFTWRAPVNSYRVIAGGTRGWSTVASDQYSPDAFYSGGGAAINRRPIQNTADDPIYQPERNGTFSYHFPLPPGTYRVTLKFSENFWRCRRCRLFDARIEGKRVLKAFDIYSRAGGRFRAIDKRFRIREVDGALDIRFDSLKDRAKIDAIDVMPLAAR